jgi:hypothetical protein
LFAPSSCTALGLNAPTRHSTFDLRFRPYLDIAATSNPLSPRDSTVSQYGFASNCSLHEKDNNCRRVIHHRPFPFHPPNCSSCSPLISHFESKTQQFPVPSKTSLLPVQTFALASYLFYNRPDSTSQDLVCIHINDSLEPVQVLLFSVIMSFGRYCGCCMTPARLQAVPDHDWSSTHVYPVKRPANIFRPTNQASIHPILTYLLPRFTGTRSIDSPLARTRRLLLREMAL